MMKMIVLCLATISALCILSASAAVEAKPIPAAIDKYLIHEDGGLIYNPLYREAKKTGQLRKYAGSSTVKRTLRLGDYSVDFQLPKSAAAYDVIPVPYTLKWTGQGAVGESQISIEATASEEEARRKGRDLYDLNLPGNLDLKIEYLGSITAHLKPGGRQNIKPDLSDTPGIYPPFERKPLVRSGVVEAGDLVWFKFRYTNTGDTILRPEGMGGWLWFNEVYRKDPDGQWKLIGKPSNNYDRDLEYLYPGESHECWVQFRTNTAETPANQGLAPGSYKIKMRAVYRWYGDFNAFINIWDGSPFLEWEMPILVEKDARQAEVAEGKVVSHDGANPQKASRWIHTSEEFMNAFDNYIKPTRRFVETRKQTGTLYLQLAPWTSQVVVKVIENAKTCSIKTEAVPISVDTESLFVKFNPKTPMAIVKDGMRWPVIASQTMADMRANIQIGPFPEKHIESRLKEMMDCGINMVSTTQMPWLYFDFDSPVTNYQGDAWKYFLDLSRKYGMQVEGWGTYPFDRSTIQDIANKITGKNVKLETQLVSGYWAISHSDPNLPAANAAAWLYQFSRWGDLYYQMQDGRVPIGLEDTRGWMRQDINIRHEMGAHSVQAFRDWVKENYKTIESVNKAWGSRYKSFEEINPDANQNPSTFGQKWEYSNPGDAFYEWKPAVEDLDTFRTEQRVKNYQDTLALVRQVIPTAAVGFRSEGANVLVRGLDPASPNSHVRHAFYSQRRVAAIADILQNSNTLAYHSDYTTLPYTPSELSRFVQMGVDQGLIPVYLPQFDNMRDIAINDNWGTDFTRHYNTDRPVKGQMMHVLTALYPWWKAVYEAGGVPGILWEDYMCDGFATVTQKREMRFFMKKLSIALNTPQARVARSRDVKLPDGAWRKASKSKHSYVLEKH